MEELKPPTESFVKFYRDELKKVFFGKGKDGCFYTMTHYLDPQTLTYGRSKISIFRKSTLEWICGVYLIEFHGSDLLKT